MASYIQANKLYHHHHDHHFLLPLSGTGISIPATNPRTRPKPLKLSTTSSRLSSSSSDKNPLQVCEENDGLDARTSNSPAILKEKKRKKKRVFFLDVNPLCYKGSTPSLYSFAHWVSRFFTQVSLSDPVIAVVKIEAHEADDVVATLVGQVVLNGYQAVVASPDKDFKQLLSQDVQIVMPMPELDRWSFYTLKHYIAQYSCDPHSDLSLRCLLGDEVDGVPGIQHFVPGFGRKTALKLLKKHGSLENLLNAAAVRTVGKPYAQDALKQYAGHLRRNYEVLSLKRDVDVQIRDQWLSERDCSNDLVVLSHFINVLRETDNLNGQSKSYSSG